MSRIGYLCTFVELEEHDTKVSDNAIRRSDMIVGRFVEKNERRREGGGRGEERFLPSIARSYGSRFPDRAAAPYINHR